MSDFASWRHIWAGISKVWIHMINTAFCRDGAITKWLTRRLEFGQPEILTRRRQGVLVRHDEGLGLSVIGPPSDPGQWLCRSLV